MEIRIFSGDFLFLLIAPKEIFYKQCYHHNIKYIFTIIIRVEHLIRATVGTRKYPEDKYFN